MVNLSEILTGQKIIQNLDGVQIERNFIADIADPILVSRQVDHCNIPLVIGDAHPTISDAKLKEIRCQYLDRSRDKSTVTAIYKTASDFALTNSYGETWRWDLNTQTTHITSVSAPGKQLNYGADVGVAIGVNGSEIKGADVYRPVSRVRVTKNIEDGNLMSLLHKINNQTATINNNNWIMYDAFNVLFSGASIGKIGTNKWEVIFNFLVGTPQVVNAMTFPDGSTSPTLTISPWQYLWFQNSKTTVNGSLKYLIKSVHIADVYESSTFANFGLHSPTS